MPRNKNFYLSSYDGGVDLDEAPGPTPFAIRLIQDPPPLPEPPAAELPPQPKSDHFYPAWDKFLAVQPTRAKVATKPARELQEEKTLIEKKQPQGLRSRETVAHSWEEAATECRAKVTAIVAECKRLNQKYKDTLFDLEWDAYCLRDLAGNAPDCVDLNGGPPWIKRVEDIFENPIFHSDKIIGSDIHQGQVGDCWFIAALVAVSAKRELIEKLCVARDEKVGVYGFVFYRDGEWIYEVIDDKLFICVGDDNELSITLSDWPGDRGIPLQYDKDKLKAQMQKGSEALYFARCKSNETWLPLIEKAYAKAHGDYATIEGGYPSEGIEDLTGGVATSIDPEDIMDKDRFWDEQMSQVNKKYLFGGASKHKDVKGIVSNHAYTVLEAWSEGDLKLLKIRNPWGAEEWTGDWSDGSKQWTPEMMTKLNHTFGDDGIFWMSYTDFFKHFPDINRVRLFDNEWQVAQLWTCVNVPWTVDYLDTRFELTVADRGPVVVVLQQPDDRYFKGLQGRYRYALHFRLYRQNESGHKYLMRSMHTSGANSSYQRSVSAELEDIEPGKYYVIFKVSAYRIERDTAQEAIVKFAEIRKDKLLQVGRSCDYAQTKGNLRAMEKKMRKQQRDDKFDRMLRAMEDDRRFTKLDRERTRQRRKRLAGATNELRKANFEKAATKRKEKGKQGRKNGAADFSTTTGTSKLTPSTDSAGGTSEEVESGATRMSDDKEGTDTGADAASKPDVEGPVASTDLSDAGNVASSADTVDAVAADVEGLSLGASEGKPVENASQEAPAPQPETRDDPSTTIADLVDAIDSDGSLIDDEEAWETPAEEIDELDDNDFDWNPAIDGPLNPDSSSVSSDAGKEIDIFNDDPWNALCVLGLRVYSKCEVKLQVRTTDDEHEQVEEEV